MQGKKIRSVSVSPVWQWFSSADTNYTVVCKVCERKIGRNNSSTSLMWHHMKQHQTEYDTVFPNKRKRINSPSQSPVKIASPNEQGELDNAIVKFIAFGFHPLRTVEEEYFINLMNKVAPTYKLPSRTKLSNLIEEKFLRKKQKLQTITMNAKFPSYAGDLWKSKSRDYYLAVSIHFIDDCWKLHSPVVALRKVTGPHSAAIVGGYCAQILQEFLGSTKPFAGVFDGGDIASVRETSNLLKCHIEERRCICHILNNAIRNLIEKHFGDKPLILEWRAFISRIHFSNPCKEAWEEVCKKVFGKTVHLQKDCPTRWSSTVTMLQSALAVREAVDQMKIDALNHYDYIPGWTDETWDDIAHLVSLFKPTLSIIEILEGDKYPSQSLIVVLFCILRIRCDASLQKFKENTRLYQLYTEWKIKLDHIWHNQLPQETLIATALDPRFKSLHLITSNEERQEALRCLEEEYTQMKEQLGPYLKDQRIEITKTVPQRNIDPDLRELLGVQTTNNVLRADNEVKKYFELDGIDITEDPLLWWSLHEKSLPVLACVAKKFLAIPASQATTERTFSTAENVATIRRTSLSPKMLEMLVMFLKNKDLFVLMELECDEEEEQ